MKKKISIILIVIFLILVGVLLTISIYKKEDKHFQVQNNEFVSEDEIEHNEKEENILENIAVQENIEVSDKNEIEKVEIIENKTENQNVLEKNNTSNSETSNKIDNEVVTKETTSKKNTTTTASNNATSISKNEETVAEEKTKEDIVKENEGTTTNKPTTDKPITDNTKTEEIIETPKCNHSNENYYNTEEEAIAFYKKTSKEYGDKVKNGEITYEEYLKKCPYGYEKMSCPYCEKWTISFYYE